MWRGQGLEGMQSGKCGPGTRQWQKDCSHDRSEQQGMMGCRGGGDQRWGCCWDGGEDVIFYPKAHREWLESQWIRREINWPLESEISKQTEILYKASFTAVSSISLTIVGRRSVGPALFKVESCNFKLFSFFLAWLGGWSVSCLVLGESELETDRWVKCGG